MLLRVLLSRREHAMRTVNMDTELIRAQHAQLSQYKTQVSLARLFLPLWM